MTARFCGVRRTIALLAILLAHSDSVSAQGFEITPYGGYRFGGDFFELITRQRLDNDGAPAIGIVIDVDLPDSDGLQVEALFTHQDVRLVVPAVPGGPPVPWEISIDHYQAGGLQELRGGRVRPYVATAFGLTHYAGNGDNEVRFVMGGGGGVKLFPWRHIGLRLNSQLFATFVDANVSAFACGSGGDCFIGFETDVVWQIEFTAGLVVRFR